MSEGDGHFENFILIAIVLCVIVGGILYGAFLFWPYLVFYLLPFVILSLIVATVCRMSVIKADGGTITGDYHDGKKYSLLCQYKSLIAVYPIMVVVTLLVFEVNSVQVIEVNKKGEVQGQVLEWPVAHKTFNKWRTNTYANSPFDSLKASARYEILFDRRQIGWIAWWALFFGGPSFFWWWSRHDSDEEGEHLHKLLEERVKAKKDILRAQIRNQDELVKSKVATYQEEVLKWQEAYKEVMSENRILMAKVEFSPEIPRPAADLEKKGVLDGDLI